MGSRIWNDMIVRDRMKTTNNKRKVWS